jgi:hypothetical protein
MRQSMTIFGCFAAKIHHSRQRCHESRKFALVAARRQLPARGLRSDSSFTRYQKQ